MLHIVEHERRVALLGNVRRLLGERGTLYYLETDFPGDLLDYMQSLGARPGDIPEPLKRCLAYGLNRPSQFGPDEHRVYFPEGQWETLASGPADVHAVPMHADDRPERIAGYFAVVRPRPPAPPGRHDFDPGRGATSWRSRPPLALDNLRDGPPAGAAGGWAPGASRSAGARYTPPVCAGGRRFTVTTGRREPEQALSRGPGRDHHPDDAA